MSNRKPGVVLPELAHTIKRILNSSSPYCDEHHRYHVLERSGEPTYCPVCRQESERDEGMDFFGGKATNG